MMKTEATLEAAEGSESRQEQHAAAVRIQSAWQSFQQFQEPDSRPKQTPEDHAVDAAEDEDLDENSQAAPTLTTSGYMTNSVSSCFSEMRASNTQDSLGLGLRPPARRWETGIGLGAEEAGETEAEANEAEADSERAQWRALEHRLTELAKSTAAAEEQQRHKQQRRQNRTHRFEQTERERVLRALSSCYLEDENQLGLESGCDGESFTSAPPGWGGCGGGSGVGDCCLPAMELCFRNDAASEDEEEVAEAPDDWNGPTGRQLQWQRFRRPPKNFVPSAVNELTRPMQLCFISDPASSDEDDASVAAVATVAIATTGSTSEESRPDSENSPAPSPPPSKPQPEVVVRPSRRPLEPELLASLGLASCDNLDSVNGEVAVGASAAAIVEDVNGCSLMRRQVQLQAEARVALAQAEPMARMQLELERHDRDRRCRDALAQLLGVAPSRRLGASCLNRMSLGALQLAHNSLLARIEDHNNELVRCLMERDDLHMEQDAMLVEIEDLTRRAHEADTVAANANTVNAGSSDVNASTSSSSASSASSASSGSSTAPVRRRMSQLTARLRPNKLVSLFTGT